MTEAPATAALRRRILRYAVVGGLGSVVYYAALWMLVDLAGVRPAIASSLVFVTVVVQNYVLHRSWTFGCEAPHSATFAPFIAMGLWGFAMNAGMMHVGAELLKLNYLFVQTVSIVMVVLCNFVGTTWIFRARQPVADGA